MDPLCKSAFDDLISRFEAMDARSADRWERIDRRLQDTASVLEQRNLVVESRLESLEEFTSSQYTAAVVADNWGGHFESRVSDLEHRMFDLECIRIVECGDERDERVADLEKLVEELKAGQPEIYAHLDDVRFALGALKHHGNQRPPPPWMAAPHELTAARPPTGSTVD